MLLPLQGSRQDGADRIGRAVGRPHKFPGPGEYTRIPPLSSALDRIAYFYAATLRKAYPTRNRPFPRSAALLRRYPPPSCGACPAPAQAALRRSSPGSGVPAECSRSALGAACPTQGAYRRRVALRCSGGRAPEVPADMPFEILIRSTAPKARVKRLSVHHKHAFSRGGAIKGAKCLHGLVQCVAVRD